MREYAEVLAGDGGYEKAREVLTSLLGSEIPIKTRGDSSERIARLHQSEARRNEEEGNLHDAVNGYEDALQYAGDLDFRGELNRELKRARLSLDEEKNQDTFSLLRQKVLDLSSRTGDDSVLRVFSDPQILSPGDDGTFSVWSSVPLDYWVVWVEPGEVHSLNYLSEQSGTRLFSEHGESYPMGFKLHVDETTPPGEIHFLVFGSSSGPAAFWETAVFKREEVNSHAGLLRQFVQSMEKAAEEGMVSGSFKFQVEGP